MSILFWILFGGLVGWIASLIMGTDASQGIFLNIVVGIVGAFLGGLIVNLVGGAGVTGFNIYSFVVAILGAMLLIWITQQVRSHA